MSQPKAGTVEVRAGLCACWKLVQCPLAPEQGNSGSTCSFETSGCSIPPAVGKRCACGCPVRQIREITTGPTVSWLIGCLVNAAALPRNQPKGLLLQCDGELAPTSAAARIIFCLPFECSVLLNTAFGTGLSRGAFSYCHWASSFVSQDVLSYANGAPACPPVRHCFPGDLDACVLVRDLIAN
eukprot:1161635-Pelagomonas_calceolata.AAC.1